MAHVLHNINIGDLLRLTPDKIGAWLESIWTGKQREPENFNWLGLAETLASRSQATEAPQLSAEWARLAVLVYEHLITTSDANYRNSIRISQMNVRANMIKRLGAVPGDFVRDPEHIRRWFLDALEFTFEETTELAAHWTELDIYRIRQLRMLKNRIKVIRSLYGEHGAISPDDKMLKWMSIWSSLP